MSLSIEKKKLHDAVRKLVALSESTSGADHSGVARMASKVVLQLATVRRVIVVQHCGATPRDGASITLPSIRCNLVRSDHHNERLSPQNGCAGGPPVSSQGIQLRLPGATRGAKLRKGKFALRAPQPIPTSREDNAAHSHTTVSAALSTNAAGDLAATANLPREGGKCLMVGTQSVQVALDYVTVCNKEAAHLLDEGLIEFTQCSLLDAAEADVATLRLAASLIRAPVAVGSSSSRLVNAVLPCVKQASLETSRANKSQATHVANTRPAMNSNGLVGLAKCAVDDKELPLALRAYFCVMFHDVLRCVCNFYSVMNSDPFLDLRRQTVLESTLHIGNVVQLMTDIASVPPFRPSDEVNINDVTMNALLTAGGGGKSVFHVADTGYYIMYSGSVFVYEMCHYLIKRSQDRTPAEDMKNLGKPPVNGTYETRCYQTQVDMYRQVIKYVGACVELCEGKAPSLFKLATVRYLPWRVRLYELVMQCYEQLELHAEALQVAQHAKSKIRELIDLELLDPVPPSIESLGIMEAMQLRIDLLLMKYTWYHALSSASRAATTMISASSTLGSDQEPSVRVNPSQGAFGIQDDNSSTAIHPSVPGVTPSALATAMETAATSAVAVTGGPAVPRSRSDLIEEVWLAIQRCLLSTPCTKSGIFAALPSRETGLPGDINTTKSADGSDMNRCLRLFGTNAVPFLLSLLTDPLVDVRKLGKCSEWGCVLPATTRMKAPHITSTPVTSSETYDLRSLGHYTFSALRQCALDALELVLFRASIAYFTHPDRLQSLRNDAQLYPFSFESFDGEGFDRDVSWGNLIVGDLLAETVRDKCSPDTVSQCLEDTQLARSTTNETVGRKVGKCATVAGAGNSMSQGRTDKKKPGLSSDMDFLTGLQMEHLFPAILRPHCVVENSEWGNDPEWTTEVLRLLSILQFLLKSSGGTFFVRLCAVARHMIPVNQSPSTVVGVMNGSEKVQPKKNLLEVGLADSLNAEGDSGEPCGKATKRTNSRAQHRVDERHVRLMNIFLTAAESLQHLKYALWMTGASTTSVNFFREVLLYHQVSIPAETTSVSSSSVSPTQLFLMASERLCTTAALMRGTGGASTRKTPEGPPLGGCLTSSYGVIASMEVLLNWVARLMMTEVTSWMARLRSTHAIRWSGGTANQTGVLQMDSNPSTLQKTKVASTVDDNPDAEEEERMYLLIMVDVSKVLLATGQSECMEIGAFALQLAGPVQEKLHQSVTQNERREKPNTRCFQQSQQEIVRQLERTRSVLTVVRMALAMVGSRQDCLWKAMRSCENKGTAELPASGKSAPSSQSSDASSVYVTTLDGLHEYLCDMRTELTRATIELRWYAALLGAHVSAHQQKNDAVKILRSRQMNTSVYGAVTTKESRILRSLLHDDPELPLNPKEEEERLLSWSFSDSLLRPMVLLSLAKLQKTSPDQRGKLTTAVELLQAYCQKEHMPGERKVYSPVVIWSYAADVCGKLQATSLASTALRVLSVHFVKEGATATENERRLLNELCEKTCDPSLVEDLLTGCTYHPNWAVLLKCSPIRLSALCTALIAVTTTDLQAVHSRPATYNGEPERGSGTGLHHYTSYHQQVLGLSCAYRLLFVLRVAQKLPPHITQPLALQCAQYLFTALTPCFRDAAPSHRIIEPLAALCYTILQLPSEEWCNATVQFLAVRVAGALYKTVASLWEIIQRGDADAATVKCYDSLQKLLYNFFATAWNATYRHPNSRQIRHIRAVAARTQRVHAVFLHSEATCARHVASTALSHATGRPGKGHARGRGVADQTDLTPPQEVPTHFPGIEYLPATPLLYDCMPVEYLDMLEKLLFSDFPPCLQFFTCVPCVGNKDQRSSGVGSTPSTKIVLAEMKHSASDGVLEGLPAILTEVATALASWNVCQAVEVLHKHAEDPLYVKAAIRIVEHALRYSDWVTARRVADAALDTVTNRWCELRQYVKESFLGHAEWLREKGYMLSEDAPTGTSSVEPTSQLAKAVVKGMGVAKARTAMKGGARSLLTSIPEDAGQEDDSNFHDVARKWTAAESQMLRQLTRAVSWVRRRQATRWLFRRIFQFNGVFRAQLHLLLSATIQMELFAGPHTDRTLQHLGTSSGISPGHRSDAPTGATSSNIRANPSRNNRRDQHNHVPAEQGDLLVNCLRHCIRAGHLFNHCFYATHTIYAVHAAVDALRTHVCSNIPDMVSEETVLLVGLDTLAHGSLMRGSLAGIPPYANTVGCDGPQPLLPTGVAGTLTSVSMWTACLSEVLLQALWALQMGYCDYRRDTEILQPAAIKVGLDCLRTEQVPFQGRIPSLNAMFSPAGQFEEDRLCREAQDEAVRQQKRLAYYRTQCVQDEAITRYVVEQDHWAELLLLLQGLQGEGLPSLASFLVDVKENLRTAEEQADETRVIPPRATDTCLANDGRVPQQDGLTRHGVSLLQPPPEGCTIDHAQPLLLSINTPEELTVELILFLARSLQFGQPRQLLRFCTVTNAITGGRHAVRLLPLAIATQHTIGGDNTQLRTAYEAARRDFPLGKTLLDGARRMWDNYCRSKAYEECQQRLVRTLRPSLEVKQRSHVAPVNECETDNIIQLTPPVALDSQTVENSAPIFNYSGGPKHSIKAVIASYERAVARLRTNREFRLLGESLYEMGRMFLLHRHRSDAEKCWRESLDALLETPRCLQKWRAALGDIPVASLGLSRILFATLVLSSLAMFIYREDQLKALDSCLLSAALLECICTSGVSLGFPVRPYDFTSGTLRDLVVRLPILETTLRPRAGEVAHHLLFVAHELLDAHYHVYSAMVASLAEHIAERFLQHIPMVVEARLLRARASARCSNFSSALSLLRGVCQGDQLPSPALYLVSLGPRHSVVSSQSHLEHNNSVGLVNEKRSKAREGAVTPGGGVGETDIRASGSGVGMRYNNAEPPTAPENIAAIHNFVTRCFPSLPLESVLASTAGGAAVVDCFPGNASGILPECVHTHYGTLLSQRVVLAVAEVLVVVGGCEGAYLWPNAIQLEPRQYASREAGRQGMESKGQVGRTAPGSACIEALRIGESLLETFTHSERSAMNSSQVRTRSGKSGNLRHRLGKAEISACGGANDADGKGAAAGGGPEKGVHAYLRHWAVLYQAMAASARGLSHRAVDLLEGCITEYNHSSVTGEGCDGQQQYTADKVSCIGKGFKTCALPHVPSFLLTLTHTYWCKVFGCLTTNYFRLRLYTKTAHIAQEAIALCEQCGDPYNARVFTLYYAAALAQTGCVTESKRIVSQLREVTARLTFRDVDPLHAWSIVAQEYFRGEKAPAASTQPDHGGDLSGAASSLAAHAMFCGLQAWVPHEQDAWIVKSDSLPISAWNNATAGKLHAALNALAARLLPFSRFTSPGSALAEHHDSSTAMRVLRQAIGGVAPQYDTKAHPSHLLESKLLLARALYEQMGPIVCHETSHDDMVGTTEVDDGSVLVTAELLALLPRSGLRQICTLLLQVIEGSVYHGTHDYRLLRIALLELATILSQSGAAGIAIAASCTVLAFLVQRMAAQVFSDTDVFHVYETDESMDTDLTTLTAYFPDLVTAAIRNSLHGTGQLSDCVELQWKAPFHSYYQDQLGGQSKAVPNDAGVLQPPGSPNQDLVTVKDLARAFATLHRERELYQLVPPLDALDHETAMLLLRKYLQERSSPPSCTYLCYSYEVRMAQLRQLLPQRGSTNLASTSTSARRGGGKIGEQQQQQLETQSLWGAFVPPVLLSHLPGNVFTSSGAETLGTPVFNTVVGQSFISAAYVNQRGGDGKYIYQPNHSLSMVTLLLVLSPFNDPEMTQPPLLTTSTDRKRLLQPALPSGGSTGTSDGKRSSSAAGRRSQCSIRSRSTVHAELPRSVSVNYFFSDKLEDIHHGGEMDAPMAKNWTCCCFALPQSVVQELHQSAQAVLQCVQQKEDAVRRLQAITQLSASAREDDGTKSAKIAPTTLAKDSLPLATSSSGKFALHLSEAMAALQSKSLPNNQQGSVGGGGAQRKGGAPGSQRGGNAFDGASGRTAVGFGGFQGTPMGVAAVHGSQVQPECNLCPLAEETVREQVADSKKEVETKSECLDNAKSTFVLSFVETIVKCCVARSVADEVLMDSCVQSLLPRCSITPDVVHFLTDWLTGDGGAATFFDPGMHEWMNRIASFVDRHRADASTVHSCRNKQTEG